MGKQGKKIKFNMISTIICQVVTIGLGFLLPRIYLENFGSAVNGVLSTIKQIFTYLGLLEAGIGLASIQALLKPVAEQKEGEISSILTATRNYYRRTGLFYSLAVSVIAVVYGFFVDTGLSAFTVISLVILNGLPSVFAFFVQCKYAVLLETDGRQYVITNSQTVLQVVSGFGKIAVLLLTNNLILMQATYCIISIAQLAYTVIYSKKHYKYLDFTVEPNKMSIRQKGSVLIHQISAMVFNNTDILLLSFICDFKTVSIYYIYNMFFSQIEIFITGLVKSFNFALGQLFHVDREEFDRKFEVYEMCYICANFIIYTLMCVFLLPLIQIYTGGITDADYINPTLLLLFVLAKMVASAKIPVNQVIEYSGNFETTKYHAVIEMCINLAVSIACIFKWGICGALFGTLAASAFRSTIMIIFVNRKVLNRKIFKTYVLWLINFGVFGAIFALFRTTHFEGMKFWPLFGHGVLNMLWIIPAYILANAIFQPKRFKSLLNMLKGKLRKNK